MAHDRPSLVGRVALRNDGEGRGSHNLPSSTSPVSARSPGHYSHGASRPRKRSVSKAIASTIGRPLVRFVSEQEPDPTSVLFIEDFCREHLAFVRHIADPDERTAFVIALTESPWELPAGLFLADAIDTIWHLDLPDDRERTAIWDLAATRLGIEAPLFDHTMLARASHEYTPAEIHASFARAMRSSRPHVPKERHLLEALTEMNPQVHARQADLLCLTLWTHYRAKPARDA